MNKSPKSVEINPRTLEPIRYEPVKSSNPVEIVEIKEFISINDYNSQSQWCGENYIKINTIETIEISPALIDKKPSEDYLDYEIRTSNNHVFGTAPKDEVRKVLNIVKNIFKTRVL